MSELHTGQPTSRPEHYAAGEYDAEVIRRIGGKTVVVFHPPNEIPDEALGLPVNKEEQQS